MQLCVQTAASSIASTITMGTVVAETSVVEVVVLLEVVTPLDSSTKTKKNSALKRQKLESP